MKSTYVFFLSDSHVLRCHTLNLKVHGYMIAQARVMAWLWVRRLTVLVLQEIRISMIEFNSSALMIYWRSRHEAEIRLEMVLRVFCWRMLSYYGRVRCHVLLLKTYVYTWYLWWSDRVHICLSDRWKVLL